MADATGPGLRPYQALAADRVVAELERAGLGQLVMACGTGKTRVAAHVAARLAAGGGIVVMLVPSLALAAQTMAAWPDACPVDRVLAVCSDARAGDRAVRAWGVPVTVSTDAEEIAKWLADAAGRRLIAGTYDSAHRLAEGLKRAGQVAELVVCDEAHRLAGPAGKFIAAVLMPGFLPARRRLHMTATPKIVTGMAASGELQAASMDDESLFGPVLYRYPFRQAIDDGWLKDYRVVIATVTSRQVADLLGGDAELTDDRDVPVRTAAAQAALAMTAARFGLRRCVTFLPRIAQARQFAITLQATLGMLPAGQRPAGPLSAGYVHGQMTSIQRELALDRLRDPPPGGWAVLANARCLGEGVDVPAIDSVLFGAPKTSVIDIVQAAGRALRRHGGTDMATIIVPALIPDDGEIGTDPGGRFENVLRVVRAMCAHDETLTADLEAARARRAADPGQPPELPARISVLAPPGTLAATLDALRIHVLARTTSSWWEGYGHARAHYEQHGNLDVPASYLTASGFRLGAWLTGQRVARNSGTLAAGRIRLLDQFGMTWDKLEAAWMSAYQELATFKDQQGHFEVPLDYRTAGGIMLAEWQGTQRDTDRAGKLAAARRALLDQIGFPWDPHGARWTRRYQQLTAALARHGGLQNLPDDSAEAIWLHGQRFAYQRGKLSPGKIALLEQTGAQLGRDDPWMASYRELLDFKDAHGHLRVPQGHKTPGGIDLSDWQRSQRARRKAGQMTPERIQLLNEAGFCWDPLAEAWNATYQQAAARKKQHGHLNLPRNHPLKTWLYRQRINHGQGRLTSEQERLLRDLGAIPAPAPGDPAPPQLPQDRQ